MTIISFPTGPFTVAADNDVVLIAEGGVVSAAAPTQALDTDDHTGLTIMNYGGILNSAGVGLRFTDGSTGSIFNQASGYIAGTSGVSIDATGADLLNLGSITGFGSVSVNAGVHLGINSETVTVENRGEIFGEVSGIRDASLAGGNSIVNFGLVEGKQFGISLSTAAGLVTHVTNAGTIKGGTAAIWNADVGRLDLTNTGKVIGDISLESSSVSDGDTIRNFGNISGTVKLGNGNDLFLGERGTSGAVFGEAGNDVLMGSVAGNALDGGIGSDTLSGRGGNDTLTGGIGADHFVFDTALPFAGADTITDFEHGIDKIYLRHAVFAKTNAAGTLGAGQFFVGARAHDANDHIIYNANNGWLIYDANGKAAGGTHHFATLDAHLTLSASDFFIVA